MTTRTLYINGMIEHQGGDKSFSKVLEKITKVNQLEARILTMNTFGDTHSLRQRLRGRTSTNNAQLFW
jgi:hypothetical protein